MSALADSVITGPMFLQAIPAEKAAALIFVPGLGWLEWVEVNGVGAFRGYRSLRCGAIEYGSTPAPRGYEADLVGGLASKTAQASLWAWAQQHGHAVAAAAWNARTFKFADVDAHYFRLPDLRGVFLRFTGTDEDTGQPVGIGVYKPDTFKSHNHTISGGTALLTIGGSGTPLSGSSSGTPVYYGGSLSAVGTAETAPKHTAFAPRIHI